MTNDQGVTFGAGLGTLNLSVIFAGKESMSWERAIAQTR